MSSQGQNALFRGRTVVLTNLGAALLQVDSAENNESMYTAMAVTVDVREGTSTGISASDRALTLRALARPDSRPEEFRRPGHIVPLRYQPVCR